ncbi:MAG: NAD(P)-dependent oxidoreductase, partial [Pseudomonadota bacterium]
MRILVTGSSGYIGSRLAVRLKARGNTVIGLDRHGATDSAVNPFVSCDLLDTAAYREAAASADLVCHLAAARGDWGISDAEYYRDNLEASEALISVLNEVGPKPCIFYSTVSVLGPSSSPLDESAPDAAIGPYGKSKADCEAAFRQYAKDNRCQVVTIRPSAVFGPGDPGNTNVYRLIDMIFRNRFLMIGRGAEIKTTSYIDNLLDAHLFLMERMDKL